MRLSDTDYKINNKSTSVLACLTPEQAKEIKGLPYVKAIIGDFSMPEIPVSPNPSDLYHTLKLQELLVLDSAQKFSEKFLTCVVCRGFRRNLSEDFLGPKNPEDFFGGELGEINSVSILSPTLKLEFISPKLEISGK